MQEHWKISPSEKSNTLSRMMGRLIIVASVVASTIIALLASSNAYSRDAEALFIECFVASALVSVIGGTWIASATKNYWWLLSFLPMLGGFGLWLLFSMMTPATFH